MRPLRVLLLLLVIASPAMAQQASFVYRLGRDTVAIEQFTRTVNRVSGEMVQRTGPSVIFVRYDMTLGPGGRPASVSLRRMQPDGSPLPNQPT